MKNLRLLITPDCNRRCKGCCNKGFGLDKLAVCEDYTDFDLVMLTGGEPMLYPPLLMEVIIDIRKVDKEVPLIIYTAKPTHQLAKWLHLGIIQGTTLTLHTKKDIKTFKYFNDHLLALEGCTPNSITSKSLRLNVFEKVKFDESEFDLSLWNVKNHIEWIKDCPLPQDEVFMRIADHYRAAQDMADEVKSGNSEFLNK